MKLVLMCLLGLLVAPAVMAAVPSQMTIQGRLVDNGSPMNGPHSADFKIFDAATGGTLLWTESSTLVATAGIFSVTLGLTAPVPTIVFDSQTRWLEVTVEGTTLAPRLPLTTNAYAFRAQHADTADFALNAPAAGDNLWSTNGTDVWRETGKVGIGVTSPTSVLDINSTTGDHNLNSIHYSATNPKIKLDALAAGNHQSEVQFLKNGTRRWSLLNDVYGDDFQNIGFKDWLTDRVPFRIDGNGFVDIGSGYPNMNVNIRGATEVSEDGVGPDTYNYGMLGVTRAATAVNNSYLALTKSATIPWGIGISTTDNLIIGTAAPGRTIPTPRLTIMPFTGNVGVGTTSPRERLHVAGNQFIDGSLIWDDNSDTGFQVYENGSTNQLIFQSSGGGSAESWAFNSAGLGNLMTVGPTVTMNRPVQINGNMTATGTKCRVVQNAQFGDLYFNATESSHALFTTEGEGQLKDGESFINLDPRWLAGVTIDAKHPMQVWITFYGPHGDYYVDRAASHDGFRVVDQSGSNACFGWKVEARQKGYEDLYLNRPEPTASK